MKTKTVLVGMVMALLPFSGCAPETKSGRGFHMPTADEARGKAAFVALGCTGCHTVEGVSFSVASQPPRMAVHLGGEVTRPRTYGELVTAIINPARDVSLAYPPEAAEPGRPTPMHDLTQEMTVAQLLDVVTFLEPRYRRVVPEYVAGLP